MKRALAALLLAGCGRADVEPLPAALLAPPAAPKAVEARDYAPEAEQIDAHKGAVTDLCFVGGLLASVSFDDQTLKLWDPADGSLVAEARHRRRLLAVAGLPDGSGLLTADAYGYLTHWPLKDERLGPPRNLNAGKGDDDIDGRLGHHPRLALSPNGRLLATSSFDPLLTVWDLETLTEIRRIAAGRKGRAIAFAPDGRGFAVGGVDNTWTYWDLASGSARTSEISKVSATSDVAGISFSPDGKLLATGHMDSSLTLWDPAAPKELRNWFVRDTSIHEVAFAPDGGRFAAAEHSGKVSLWSADPGGAAVELAAFEGAAALSLAFSPDGGVLAAGSAKGAVALFR